MNRDLNGVFEALRRGEQGAREALIDLTYQDLIQWGSRMRVRLVDCPLMEVEDLAARVFMKLRAKPAWDFDSLSGFRTWAIIQMNRAYKDAYRREFCFKRGGGRAHLSLEEACLGDL